jgi:hypothetical protein
MQRHLAVVIVIFAALPLWAQTEETTAAVSASIVLPSSVNGELVPAETVREGHRKRAWGGRLEFATTCDDNLLSASAHTVSDCSFGYQPSFSFRQIGSRTSWDIGYMPSYTTYRKYSNRNELDQLLGIDWQHKFTRRLAVRVRESFAKSSNFFNALPTSINVPNFGLMQRPNDAVVLPIADQISSTTGVEATYQLGAASFAGMSATYSDLQYTDNPNSATLYRTRTATAAALYSRRLGSRHWLGVNYNFAHLRIAGIEWVGSHTILYTHTILLTPRLSISGFAGPQYSKDHQASNANIVVPPAAGGSAATWSAATGTSIGWATKQNTLTASFARRTNNSGGLFGAATVNAVNFGVARKFTSKLAGNLGLNYSRTAALSRTSRLVTGLSGVHTTSLNTGLEYALARHFSLRGFYIRDWQENLSGSLGTQVDRNRAGFSLAYTFGQGLER